MEERALHGRLGGGRRRAGRVMSAVISAAAAATVVIEVMASAARVSVRVVDAAVASGEGDLGRCGHLAESVARARGVEARVEVGARGGLAEERSGLASAHHEHVDVGVCGLLRRRRQGRQGRQRLSVVGVVVVVVVVMIVAHRVRVGRGAGRRRRGGRVGR